MRHELEWSVGELARRAGVTVRTLHHFDSIGLLRPARGGANGYRVYREPEALRLQEILFYRAVGMPLSEIARTLDAGSSQLERLRRHRPVIAERLARAQAMLDALDASIAHLEGRTTMATDDLYRPFAPTVQAEYEAWLEATYGPEMAERVAHAKKQLSEAPGAEHELARAFEPVEQALLAHYERGEPPDAAAAHEALEALRALVARSWGRPCEAEGFAGLAELYRSHADFVARYERLSPGFSEWLPLAMDAHARRIVEPAS